MRIHKFASYRNGQYCAKCGLRHDHNVHLTKYRPDRAKVATANLRWNLHRALRDKDYAVRHVHIMRSIDNL